MKRYSRAWRGDYIGARKDNLTRLPIAIPDEEQQDAIIAAYDECVRAASQLDEARSDAALQTVGRIYGANVTAFDQTVFDLYGVTAQELRVIRSG